MAELPAQTFHVRGNGSTHAEESGQGIISLPEGSNISSEQPDHGQVDNQAGQGTSTGRFWQFAAVLFAMLWLTFALLWWHLRRANQQTQEVRTPATPVAEKQAFKALRKAGENRNPAQLRLALLRWGQRRWPDHYLQTLQDLGLLINDPHISEQFSALDASLYGKGDTVLDPEKLVELVRNWRQQVSTNGSDKASRLKPLYNS